jgi:hypothetical protein
MCGGGKCMAKGGEVKGVHADEDVPKWVGGGMSKAGLDARVGRDLKDHPAGHTSMEDSKAAHREKLGELKSMPDPKLKGLAEGGEVEDPAHEEDHEMHDMLGQEMMGAIHGKDHKGLMSCIEAAVLNCMNKKGE